jgi:TolB-like protein
MLSRSPRAALAVALLLAAAPALPAQEAGAPDTRPTIAVLDFRNGAIGRAADYESLQQGIAELLITDLSRNERVRVLERANVDALLREQDLGRSDRLDAATAARIGRMLGVRHMITGGFVIAPNGDMRLVARAVDVETSRVSNPESVEGKADDVLRLIARLSDNLNERLELPPIPPAPAGGESRPASGPAPAPTPPTRVAGAGAPKGSPFQAVLLYSRALAEEDRGNREGAVELYRKALDAFPGNESARARLARLQGGE